jgi:hypothetical protein
MGDSDAIAGAWIFLWADARPSFKNIVTVIFKIGAALSP